MRTIVGTISIDLTTLSSKRARYAVNSRGLIPTITTVHDPCECRLKNTVSKIMDFFESG